jgi:uncharacterized protein YegP (UPF0339 family)
MATPTKKAHAARQVSRPAPAASNSAAMTLLVFEDNSGDHRWSIVNGSGERLVQSETFLTHGDAQRAAHLVLDGSGSARFEPQPA